MCEAIFVGETRRAYIEQGGYGVRLGAYKIQRPGNAVKGVIAHFGATAILWSMKLTSQEVEKIATLARLSLTDEEKKLFTEQLSGVLSYVEQLQQVPTEGVEETAQVTGLENIYRDDALEQSAIQEKLVAQAHDSEEGFVKAKSVF